MHTPECCNLILERNVKILSYSENTIKERRSGFDWRPNSIIIIMDFNTSMLDFHVEFIPGPFICIRPLREISQETPAHIIDFPKGC